MNRTLPIQIRSNRIQTICSVKLFGYTTFAILNIIVCGLLTNEMASADDSRDTLPKSAIQLFDGSSFSGWNLLDNDRKWWRIEDATIAGGSLEETVPHNTFLCTDQSFSDFELRLKLKLTGTEGFINSGIQIRSVRDPNSPEMIGYQVDAGDGWWGKLYDESRRNKVIGGVEDYSKVEKAIKKDDWNEYTIRAEGPRIQAWINGTQTLDFTETDPEIPLKGQIGLQTHGGGKLLVYFKDIEIIELPVSE